MYAQIKEDESPSFASKAMILRCKCARNSRDAASQLRHHRSVETHCSQCGAAMTCQPEGGCWCAELPNCAPMPKASAQGEAEGCLCLNCLHAKIEALRKMNQVQKA